MSQGTTPPGWYDDGQGTQRWWDGSQWTDHTQPTAGDASPATPQSPAGDPHAEPTRVGPPSSGPPSSGPPSSAAPTPGQGVGLDKGTGATGGTPAGPSGDVTRIAGAGGVTPPGQPAYGQRGGYGQPAQQAYGQQGGYGQPAQPAYGQQGGAPGQPAWQSQYPTSSSGGPGKLIAIIGGVAVVLIIGVVLLVVLLGGGGPQGVAEDYIEAQTELEFERVCELTAEDQQQEGFDATETDDCGSFADIVDDQFTGEIRGFFEDIEFDIEIGDVEEDGDEATVDYTVTSEYTGDDEDGFRELTGEDQLEDEENDTLDLVKEDGDWKVAESVQ